MGQRQIPIQVRLPEEVVAALDAYAVEQRRRHPERLWTRSEIVRGFILDGLKRKR